jgi:hypothetical protein
MPGFLGAVTGRGLESEADHHRRPRAWIGRREIAEDAAADVLALRAYADGLAHLERAVAIDLDGAVEGENSLVGPCGCDRAAQGGKRQ